MKLSKNQIETIKLLRQYPKELIMFNGYLTGGHGIRVDLRTLEALKNKGLIERDKLTELGKTLIF